MTKAISALLLLTALSLAYAQEEPIRTVLQTGFEEGLAPFTVSWGNATLATDAAHSGATSVRMEDGGAIEFANVPYAPGQQFRLSYWMRTQDIVRGEQRMVHVLAAEAVEERQCLLTVGGVIGGAKLNYQQRRAPDIGDGSLDQQVVEGAVFGGGDTVLEAGRVG